MDNISDPDTFQISQIVEKSNKSGIFSNKRLLVIKNGFLYYFTNVPKNYKGHIPNVLNSLKELPKSSIEIRAIHTIKMQSTNSPNLIITFQEKDMIQREDIRKSITDKNYRHTKKTTKNLEQWKFTFSSVLQCRLWYTTLLKLKSHFMKQEQKISEFFNAFDPAKRNSQLPSQIKKIFKKDDDSNSERSRQKSEVNIIEQFHKQDEEKKKNPTMPVLPTTNIPSPKSQEESQQSPKSNSQERDRKPSTLQIIKEEDEPVTMKQDDSSKELVVGVTPKNIVSPKNEGFKKNTVTEQKKQHKVSPLKLPTQDKETLKKEREQLQKRIRKQQQQKSEKIIAKMKQEIQKKDRQVTNLQYALNSKEKQLQMIERTREEQKMMLRNSQIYENQHTLRTIELNEFSVQTDEQDEHQPLPINNSFQSYPKGKTYQSFLEDFNSTHRDTYNFYRNTDSLNLQLQEKQKNYDNYDFYSELGELYFGEGQKKSTSDLSSQKVKFEGQIKRQIKMINYIEKMRGIAEDTIKEYIDETIFQMNEETKNKNQCYAFQSTLFYIKIAYSSGKIVNIHGKQKLVYSNKEHQNLKREFKIYNILQNRILKLLKRKSNYPVRVPLSYLFEYRGFTALLQYLPYIKTLSNSPEQELRKLYKLSEKIIQDREKMQHYDFNLIANRQNTLYLATIKQPYKISSGSQELKSIGLQSKIKSQYIYSVLETISQHQKSNISINNYELSKEAQKMRSEIAYLRQKKKLGESTYVDRERERSLKQKCMSINQLILCRNLKNLFRSTEPYAPKKQIYLQKNTPKFSTFLQGFLSSPLEIKQLVSSEEEGNQLAINGLLLSYFETLYGFIIPTNINLIHFFQEYQASLNELEKSYNEEYIEEEREGADMIEEQLKSIQIGVKPVHRSFNLWQSHCIRLLDNIELYVETQKYNLVDSAIEIMHQIEHKKPERNWKIHLSIIKYKLKTLNLQNLSKSVRIHEANHIEILKRCKIQLQDILFNISPNNTLKFQCQLLLIQTYASLDLYPQTIQLIFETINHLHYMLGEQYAGGEMDDCLYLLAAQILAKMGKIKESLTIYKKLLMNEETAIANQQIFLSMAEVSKYLMDSGPSQVIQLLLPLISQSNINFSDGNITKSTSGCYLSKHHSRIYNLVAHQYLLLNNIDQATKYFEYSLAYYLNLLEGNNNKKTSSETVNRINIITMTTKQNSNEIDIDISTFTDNCVNLFNFYSKNRNEEMLSDLMETFGKFIEWSANTVYNIGGTCWRREKSYFLTAASETIIKSFLQKHSHSKESLRTNLLEMLEQMRDKEESKKDSFDIEYHIKYVDLVKVIQKMGSGQMKLVQKQIQTMNEINLSELQTFILSI